MADRATEERDADLKLLIQACLYDNIDFLKDLIEGGEQDINQVDRWGRTPVYTCVSHNSMRCLEMLIANGADINRAPFESSCDKRTPLHTAVFDEKVEAVKLLLKYGASVSARDRSGRTPFDIAKQTGNREIVAFLNAAIEINNRERNELSQKLYTALSRRDVAAILEVLREKNVEHIKYIITKPPGDGFPALCSACKLGNLEIVKRLLDFHERATELAHRGIGYTPLHIACEHNNVPLMELLLQKFPEQIVMRTVDHQLPLHTAAVCGMADAVSCLLHFPFGSHYASRHDDPATGLTYRSCVDVNKGDINGCTPLHLASEKGYLNVVQLLLGFSVHADSDPRGFSKSDERGSVGRSDVEGYPRSDEGGGVKEADPHCRRGGLPPDSMSSNVAKIRSSMPNDLSNVAKTRSSMPNDSSNMAKTRSSMPNDSSNVAKTRSSMPNDSSNVAKTRSSMPNDSSAVRLDRVRPVNVNLVTVSGHTALHLAVKGGHSDIAELLLGAGADVKMPVQLKDGGVSLLRFTLSSRGRGGGDAELFQLMMQHGAEDADGSVMTEAIRRGNRTVQQLLMQHRSSRDLTRVINKSEMKLRWLETQQNRGAALLASFSDRSSSIDADHRAVFPLHSVAVNWQNIGAVGDVSKDTLRRACFLHNPAMQRVNSLPLFAITKIDISKNAFVELPLVLFRLFSLCVLNASGNGIEALPSEEDVQDGVDSTVLEELQLGDNCLSRVPSYLFKLPKLKHLGVSKNKLDALPIDMWTAPALVVLNLSQNKLSSLPYVSSDDFGSGSCPKTKKKNSGTSCGSESSDIRAPSDTDSVHSVVRSNPVQHIKRWQAGVPVDYTTVLKTHGQTYVGIRQLDLSKNRFRAVPECLACCAPQLEVLSLQENPLDSLGPLTSLPDGLVELNLSHCGLETLDPWSEPCAHDKPCLGFKLGSFCKSSLTSSQRSSPDSQSVGANVLGCPHRGHSALRRLEKLSVAHNRLLRLTLMKSAQRRGSQVMSGSDEVGVQAPTEISDTTCSVGLKIEEIRSRLLFPELSELDVSSNKLTALPSEIGEHANLKVLCLNWNPALKELPPRLGMLKQLWKLEVQACPLEGAIQDFIRNSPSSIKDILGFLLSVFEESTQYNCMNLMLVGSHKIGKTSLLHRLRSKGETPHKVSHWNERMHDMKPVKTEKDEFLSTVGIDINELIIKHSSDCIVNFRTWDFGGQREYYATHQYFLSPRSLYLVIWDITEGQPGINSLMQWLVNIQARAPGASVIIVGTHLDLLKDTAKYPEDYEEAMASLVRKMFLMNKEPDKCGLPNILDTIHVSCKNGKNISDLVKLIAYHAFEMKHPRSRTQKLLKQKIPKKYLLLKSIVEQLARERKEKKKDPVLTKSKYMLCVSDKMMDIYQTTFRDLHEIDQATRFLHENGVIFHYDDLHLRDLFFLDPQWLCDQLAKVVTIKEINNYASRGVMETKHLNSLFKNSQMEIGDIKSYITNLLNKFEVALKFDENHLLLPSLLPTEQEHSRTKYLDTDIKIPLRRENGLRRHLSHSIDHKEAILRLLEVKSTSNPIFSYCRLYFMTYFPSGFWPRLITRVLADPSLFAVVTRLFPVPGDLLTSSPGVRSLCESAPEWRCWQTGLSLHHLGAEVLRVREVQLDSPLSACDYSLCRVQCNVDSEWTFLDVVNSKLLEISFQTDSLTFQLTGMGGPQVRTRASARAVTVCRDDRVAAGVMVKVVSHVDNLLQDWYPELGEQRFTQNCEGRYLITRVIPCPHCLFKEVSRQKLQCSKESWMMVNQNVATEPSAVAVPSDDVFSEDVFEPPPTPGRLLAGQILQHHRNHGDEEHIMYAYLVERCMLDVLMGVDTCCPVHKSISPVHLLQTDGTSHTFYIAPDVVFADLRDDVVVKHTDRLDVGERLGQGTFGEVFAGKLFRKGEEPAVPVAIKILFKEERHSSKQLGMEQQMEKACQSYLTARQEISILEKIQHPNIVPLLGLAVRPLSLLLSLAPQGGLNRILKTVGENGQKLPLFVIRQVILQIADALMYLHNHHIIYRDLKSENVLVWAIPTSADARPTAPVLVKLADYGISQSVDVHAGTKGFGGTPPFIAPEILQHAGKDTYTEKVDIFSFGMFIYELITCRLPFADVHNPSTLVCQGKRPAITAEEASVYPCYMLDLMFICWWQEPSRRPTAAGIIDVAQSPQFCHLRDVIVLGNDTKIFCVSSIPVQETLNLDDSAECPGMDLETVSLDDDEVDAKSHAQVWMSTGYGPHYHINVYLFDRWKHCVSNVSWQLDGPEVRAMTVFGGAVWCIDDGGWLHIYCSRTREPVLKQKLPVQCRIQVHGMFSVAESNLVLIVLKNGDIMQCEHDLQGDNSPTVTITTIRVISNMCSALVETRQGYKIWLGCSESGGKIVVWDFDRGNFDEGDLAHPLTSDPTKKCFCKFLLAAPVPGIQDTVLWSYVYPGKTVYRWDVNSQCVVATLDCSDIVTTTRTSVVASPKRGDVDYQVTSLNVFGAYLYIGTTWGNVIIADALTMKPLNVFRSHCAKEFYVKYILTLDSEHPTESVDDDDDDVESSTTTPGIVTIGRGFVDMVRSAQNSEKESESESDGAELESKPRAMSATHEQALNNNFLISWSATDWQYY